MSSGRATPFDDLDATAVLTAAESALRLRVDARSMRRAIGRGELPASRTCGIRVLAADAAAWWRERSVGASAAAEQTRPEAPARVAVSA